MMPFKIKDVETISEMIDDYFTNTPEEEWTITGLALSLGISRKILIEYCERTDGDFAKVIKTAKQRVENAYEKSLRKYGRSGDIFALKNFGWHDKQEIDANVDASVEIVVDCSD